MTETLNGTHPNQKAALEYAALGMSTIPMGLNKYPRIKWKRYQTERPTREEIMSWAWDNGVMVVTGELSGIAVLDADSSTAVAEVRRRGIPPDTPQFRTKNGCQYVFKHPGVRVKTCAGVLAPNLDVRGDGGVTAVPPSPDKVWEVHLPNDLYDLPDFPAWALEGLNVGNKARGAGVDPVSLLDGVDEGERDDTIYRALCKLRRDGWPKYFAKIYAREAAQSCNPPFDAAEAAKKVDRIYAQYPEGGGEKPTEDVLRNRFLNAFPNYAHGQGEWKRYDDGFWSPVDDDEILAGVFDVLEDAKPEGIKPTAGLGRSVAEMARVKARVDHNKWDADPDVLVCRNGTLHIPTRELRTHSLVHYATSAVPYDYDPDARAHAWGRFLDSTVPENVALFLQEFAGYALTPETLHEIALWLYGPPGTGKSTFLTGLMAMLGPKYGTLSLTDIDRNRFALGSKVPGKTLLVATESPGGFFRSTDKLNSLISGETISAERKYRDPVDIAPRAKIAWAMNELPRVSDPNNGIFRRVKVVEFPERPTEPDPELKEAIKGEGAGILNWALEGLDRLRERGQFEIPESVKAATSEFKESNDVAAMFVSERCKKGDGLKTSAADLYEVYKDWCQENGYNPKAINSIARDWKRLGFQSGKSNGVRFYHGVDVLELAAVVEVEKAA